MLYIGSCHAEKIKIAFIIYFQNRPCQLIVHLDRGFSLVDSGLAAPAKILWSYAFDQLKASADDGNRLLFLDFGEGEIVSIPTKL